MKKYRYVIHMAIPTSAAGYGLMAHGTALFVPPNPTGRQGKATQGYRAPSRPNLKGHKFAQVFRSSLVMSPLNSFDSRSNDCLSL